MGHIKKYLIETFRDYKNKSNDDHIHKHTVKGPADQQDLERSKWLTNNLETLIQRFPFSFDNGGCLETAISVSYLNAYIKF